MISPILPVVTERLLLRHLEPTDLDALAAYCTRPEAQRYLDFRARDRSELEASLPGVCAQRRLNRPGDLFTLGVARRSDKVLLGHVTLRWTDATAAQSELRLVFNPAYRGHGYAAEAVAAALDLGFEQFDMHRIFARCGADNPRAAKLLKAIGMRLEAHYREHALFQGNWDDELHFAILDREWRRGAKVRELDRHRVA